MRQHVAALVDVALHLKAVERRERVAVISLNGHSKTELPCALAGDVAERCAAHRRPAVDLVEHALRSTLATFALCTETDEQRACCVALEVVVGAVGYGREEEFAARIFPNVAVVVRSHCTHALLSYAVVDEQLLAVVRHAHLHRGAVRESLSPAVVVYCHEADVRLVEHAADICCTN